jgi:hypothetical protein
MARGTALTPYGAGLFAVPDWTTPVIWPYDTAASGFHAGITLAATEPGLAGTATDPASGLWTVAYGGSWWHLSSGGVVAASGVLPSGQVYQGCATPGGSAYFLAASGTIFSSGSSALNHWPVAARMLTSSGTTLAALLPASGIGLMAASGGATGIVSLPAAITTASCLTARSGILGIGGWATAAPLSGAAAAAIDPQVLNQMAAVGSGHLLIWQAPSVSGEAWTQYQQLAGLTNLTALAWRPDGVQILAASPSSGVLQSINYIASTLSLNQTLSVSGACSVVVAPDSAHALVAQSGAAQILPFTQALDIWTSGTALTGYPGIAALTTYPPSGAAVAWSSGLSFLTLTSGGVWAPAGSASIGFAPKVLTTDPFGMVYAAGSGALAVFSGTAYLGSGAWTGGVPSSIAVQEGRVVMAVPIDSRWYIFGETTPNSWTQQASGTLSLGASVGLALSQTVLFMMGSGATNTYSFSGLPYSLTPVRSGVVGFYTGSWVTAGLGVGHTPSACCFDPSGNLRVATVENTLWTITSGGVTTSGNLPSYQLQTVPLGISALYQPDGTLYALSSLAGGLTRVTG